MPDQSLAAYLVKEKEAALRAIALEPWLYRLAGFVIGVGLGGVVIWAAGTLADDRTNPLLLPLRIGVGILFLLGRALWITATELPQQFQTIRAEIRANLTRGGLLRLAAELDARDRLPRLFGTGIARVLFTERDKATLRGRLMALAFSYRQCCQDMGLLSPEVERYVKDHHEGQHPELIRQMTVIEIADALEVLPEG